MPWLRLIRWKNLLIIFCTQLIVWWCIITPLSPRVLTPVYFFLLSLSTVLIAAAGYIINDYFDVAIDSVNRPAKVIVEKLVTRREAIKSHIILNVAALVLATYVAAKAHHLAWLTIQIAAIALLWFYSAYLKRMFMAGNLVVSALTAITVMMLAIYEPAIRHNIPGHDSISPLSLVAIYSLFAFILTWIREAVKDMEDLKGDMQQGCKTMPVRWGIPASAAFVLMLGIIAVAMLAYCSYYLLSSGNKILSLYIFLLLIIPMGLWMVHLGRDKSDAHFHKSSSYLKLIMLSGIASLIVYYCV